MKIAVIGGGWYGCHIALCLIEQGQEVRLFEKQNELFEGSSGNTIGRVHRGYHYPRSFKTLNEIQLVLEKFSSKYKDFIFETSHNLYAIPNNYSLIDWGCFTNTLSFNKLKINEQNPDDYNLKNLEGIGSVDESFINLKKVKQFFENKLAHICTKNTLITHTELNNLQIGKEKFDWIINCTFNELELVENQETVSHESYLFELKRAKKTKWDSLTLMDGNFFSITPQDESLEMFYLYDVESQSAFLHKKGSYEHIFHNYVLPKINGYYPDFLNHFELKGFKLAQKKVSSSFAAERTLKIVHNNNIISVFPSKISSVCLAEDSIKNIIFG